MTYPEPFILNPEPFSLSPLVLSKEKMNKKLLEARDNIIESAGRTTQGFGMGRIIGQLYALLFFNPEPMSLDDMVDALKVSKGSVSTNIRELEKWGAVRQIWVKGDRKDYYEAETDFLRIIREGVIPFFKRKVDSSFVATSESKGLISNNVELKSEDKKLAQFYFQRLDLIEKAQSRLALLLKLNMI